MENTTEDLSSPPIYVAYADDHELLRVTVISHIEALGGIDVIIVAKNGRELIETIENSLLKPSVCIIDIKMPEMNGFETVAYIKKMWPEMKILILTGHLRDSFVIRMIFAGVHGYLSKNCHPRTIKEAIQEVHENGIYCNELFNAKDISAVQDGKKLIPKLSPKEIELLRYCIQDRTYSEIASSMHTSQKSVEGYRNKLFQKTGAKSRTGLAMYAVIHGYVDLDDDIL